MRKVREAQKRVGKDKEKERGGSREMMKHLLSLIEN